MQKYRIINDLRDQASSIALESKISRAQMIFGNLGWSDWTKREKVKAALKYFEEEKAKASQEGKKLILKIRQ